MPLLQNTGSEPRGVRTLRVAVIAGTVGCLIGGTIVVGSVATVLSVINPQPKQTSLTAKASPPVETTGVAPPAAQVATADDKNDCANQTWPNIEQRCLKRVDNVDQQTTAAADDEPATAPGIVPSELQPGSPALPAPVAVLPAQPPQAAATASASPPAATASTSPPHTVTPQLAVTPQPTATASVPPAPPVAQAAPVADAPAKKAASAKPVRKTEPVRRAPKAVVRQVEDDDGDAPALATSRRARPQPTEVVEPAPRGRAMARRSIDADDVVVERPRRSASPLGFFGCLFGSDND